MSGLDRGEHSNEWQSLTHSSRATSDGLDLMLKSRVTASGVPRSRAPLWSSSRHASYMR